MNVIFYVVFGVVINNFIVVVVGVVINVVIVGAVGIFFNIVGVISFVMVGVVYNQSYSASYV